MSSRYREKTLRQIARRYRPKGWKVEEIGAWPIDFSSDGVVAWVDWTKRTIYCPPIRCRAALAIYLHEVGHIVLRHDMDTWDRCPAWQTEYEAETWAWRAMRENGVPVPKEVMDNGRNYVRAIIEDVFQRSGDKDRDYYDNGSAISEDVARFAYGKNWRNYI